MKNTNKKNNASINIDDIFGHDRKELDNCFEICYTEHDGLLYPRLRSAEANTFLYR
ncbi:MAG: hypothetical protein L6V84_00415 [Oscillospiraceae bacterium]|nr:MAG: hypothetical protein L6V84_00415 [Oscillospiraceae bacterium]